MKKDYSPCDFFEVATLDYLLTISIFVTKKTKQNVIRTGILSVNLVSTDMLELMDYFSAHHAKDGKKVEFYTLLGGEMS